MSNLTSNTNNDKTITFDVGGTIYKVSRSLLEQYPDTMLARLVSDTWIPSQDSNENKENNGNTTTTALYIERDGERFKYCLDYMRDAGRVALPDYIPKDALIKDLIYYGFQDIDSSKITMVGSVKSLRNNFNHIDSFMSKLATCSMQLQWHYDLCELARFCLRSYKKNANLKVYLGKEMKHKITATTIFYYSIRRNPNGGTIRTIDLANNFIEAVETKRKRGDFDDILKDIGLKSKKFERNCLFLDYL